MTNDTSEKPRMGSPLVLSDEQIEEIRQAVKAVLAHEGVRTVQAAAEAGVNDKTLGLWLSGKYAGRNDRVALDMRRWLDTREARNKVVRSAPKGPAFVMTPTASEVMSILLQAQHMPDIGVYVGAPGLGKTEAALHYAPGSSNVWMITANPTVISPHAVLKRLCRVLGLPGKGLDDDVLDDVCDRVRGSGGLIIVDEAQHLMPKAHDMLRAVHDAAKIGVALLGNEAIHARIGGDGKSAQFAQLTSRIGVRMSRASSQTEDVELLLDAWKVEGKPERSLLRAIARKPGALRLVAKTLKLAHLMAGPEELEVTAPLIRRAFSRVSAADVKEAA